MGTRKTPFRTSAATLDLFRSHGWVGDNAEQRNKFGRKDYLGFADLVMIKSGQVDIQQSAGYIASTRKLRAVALQVCATCDFKKHLDKMQEPKRLAKMLEWMRNDGEIAIVGWGKKKLVRGGTAFRHEVTRFAVLIPGTSLVSVSVFEFDDPPVGAFTFASPVARPEFLL